MTYVKVTDLQRKWLFTQGGRYPMDVVERNSKLVVPMGDGKGGIELIELPNDKVIKTYYKLTEKNGQIKIGLNFGFSYPRLI